MVKTHFILAFAASVLLAGTAYADAGSVQMLPPTASGGTSKCPGTGPYLLTYDANASSGTGAINCNQSLTADNVGNVNDISTTSQFLHATGPVGPMTTQGAYLSWNHLTGGTGETDLINNHGYGGGGFAFMNGDGTNANTKVLMLIDGTGDLTVNGTGQFTGRLFSGTSGTGGMWVNGNPSSNPTEFVGSYDASKVGFYNNGLWSFIIDDAGHVGINNTSPTDALDVTGSIGVSSSIYVNGPSSDSVVINSNQIWNQNPSASGLYLNYSAAANSVVYIGNGNNTQSLNVLKGSLCLNGSCISSWPSTTSSGLSGSAVSAALNIPYCMGDTYNLHYNGTSFTCDQNATLLNLITWGQGIVSWGNAVTAWAVAVINVGNGNGIWSLPPPNWPTLTWP